MAGATRHRWFSVLTALVMVVAVAVAVSRVALTKPVDATSATPIQVNSNPVVRQNSGLMHYSSDPSVIEIVDTANNHDLVMVSSSDLVGVGDPHNFPMRQTFLYATFGGGIGDPIATTWYDHGPVLNESQFTSWSNTTNHLWAPDIQVFGNELWLYVPDQDKNGTFRVGMAHATISNGIYADTGFMAEQSFLQITGNGPNSNYMFDPGVFSDQVNPGYVVYTDAPFNNNAGNNLSIAALHADHKSATYLGKVRMNVNGPLKGYSGITHYMEGPDVFILQMPGRSARVFYYLVFASSVENATDDTGYIGYAMCTDTAFLASPTDCWNFKGWIFRNLHTGRSNQASLVQFQDSNHVFFHKAPAVCCSPENSRARQVSALRFQLVDNPGGADDGQIVDVTYPTTASQVEDATQYGTLDGLAPDFAPGFIYLRDEDDGKNTARIDVMSMQNVSNTTFTSGGQKLYYYLNVEPGSALQVSTSPSGPAGLALQNPALKHISQNTWAVIMNYVGPDLAPGQSLGFMFLQLLLSYNSGTFNKLNDFSRPLGNYKTPTNRIAVFDTSGNLLAGRVPDTSANTDLFKVLRTEHLDAAAQYTYLMASFPQADVGINNQNLNTGSTLQQWYLERVTDFTNIQGLPTLSTTDKQNAYRLRNKGTNNLYMTSNDVNHGTFSQPSFFVLSQALRSNPGWATQIWIREPVGDGSFRFRSAWIPGPDKNSAQVAIYLTLDQNAANTGKQDVFVQVKNNPLDRQHWLIE